MKKIYLFAVIFALITGFATYFFVDGLKHNANITGEAESDVVIALQNIDEDTVVTPSMFEVLRLPVSSISYGTVCNISDIDGFVVTEKIFKGEQVLAAKLTQPGKNGNGLEYNGEYRLSYRLENGNYAYSFAVDAKDAVSYFVRRGDYINIYHVSSDKPVMRNVRVIETGTYSDKKASLSGTETTSYDMVTVSLTEKQLAEFMKYDDGLFSVVLVSYAEGAQLTTLPEKTTVNENGETVTVPRVEEPVTNYGMGEVQTTTTTTAKAK